MAPRSRKVMLSFPSSLPGHSDLPTPVVSLLPVSSDSRATYYSKSTVETLGSQVPHRYLSPHADGLTPGSLQVLLPFASLQALAFPISVEGRRIARIVVRVYPSTILSQLLPYGVSSRSCTIRFMLRPAVLVSPPDWVQPVFPDKPSRDIVRASSASMLPHEPAPSLHI
jgi:hypothetical protein